MFARFCRARLPISWLKHSFSARVPTDTLPRHCDQNVTYSSHFQSRLRGIGARIKTEQGTENPRVGSSLLSLATLNN